MLRTGLLTLAVWMAAGPLFGQTGDAGSIEGQVVNRNSGAPLGPATVELSLSAGRPNRTGLPQPTPSASVQTDEQGRFAFRNLAAGLYSIRAQKQGFLSGPNGQAASQLILGERQELKGALLKLMEQSSIGGKVTGRNGEGLSRATVTVFRQQYIQSKAQWVPVSMGVSGDQGDYRVEGIAPGHYRIGVTYHENRNPPGPPAGKPEMRYVTTYYPDSVAASGAQLVTVEGGAAARADIHVQMTPAVAIRGKVLDPNGNPVNALAMLISKESGNQAAATPPGGPAGSFEFDDVAPGQYFLSARLNAGASVLAATQVVTVADKALDEIVLKLGPGRDVAGTTQMEDGAAFDPRNLTIIANSLDGMGSSVAVKGNGASEFVLRNLAAGRASLTVYPPGNVYVKSIQYGGKDIPPAGADLTGGEGLSVVLSNRGAQLGGHVTDASAKPPNRAILTLLTAGGQTSDLEQTFADRNGDFRFRMLGPGEYKLYAWETADAPNLQDADFYREFESKAKTVKLEAGGSMNVAVQTISAAGSGPLELPHAKATVEGTVSNAKTGEPLKSAAVRIVPSGFGAIISASSPYTSQSGPVAQTDEQGHFLLRGLEAGAYQLSADRAGFLNGIYGLRRDMTADPLIVGEGQALKGLSLKLTPQFVITGKVTDESGDPAEKATVTLYSRDSRSGEGTLVPLLGWIPIKETIAGSQGDFRFDALAAGTYLVSARPDPPAPAAELAMLPVPDFPEMRYVTTYYPDSVDLAGAKALALEGGASTVRADIKVHKTKTFEVRGTLTNVPAPGTPGGIPLGAIPGPPLVRLYPRDNPNPQMPSVGLVVARPNASFAILNVPPGSYILVARSYAMDPAHLFGGSMPIEVRDQHLDGVQIPLKPGIDLKARVVWDPPSAARGGGLFALLTSYYPVGSQAPGQAIDDATMIFRGVLPMPYRLDIAGFPQNCSCFLKSVRYGGREVAERGTDFSTGEPLEIILSASAAAVNGTVVDRQGKMLAGATVALFSAGGKVRTSSTDESGKFVLDGVAPGDYQLLAWEDIDAATLKDAGVAARFAADAKQVKLEPLGHQTVEVVAIPAR